MCVLRGRYAACALVKPAESTLSSETKMPSSFSKSPCKLTFPFRRNLSLFLLLNLLTSIPGLRSVQFAKFLSWHFAYSNIHDLPGSPSQHPAIRDTSLGPLAHGGGYPRQGNLTSTHATGASDPNFEHPYLLRRFFLNLGVFVNSSSQLGISRLHWTQTGTGDGRW